MKSLDVKSCLIGALLAVLILCFLGGAAPSVWFESHGRFQITVNENRAFMVDTATGKVWSEEFVVPQPGPDYYPFDDPNCAFCLPKLDVEGMLQ